MGEGQRSARRLQALRLCCQQAPPAAEPARRPCLLAAPLSLGLDEFGDDEVTEANPWEGEEEEDVGEGKGKACASLRTGAQRLWHCPPDGTHAARTMPACLERWRDVHRVHQVLHLFAQLRYVRAEVRTLPALQVARRGRSSRWKFWSRARGRARGSSSRPTGHASPRDTSQSTRRHGYWARGRCRQEGPHACGKRGGGVGRLHRGAQPRARRRTPEPALCA